MASHAAMLLNPKGFKRQAQGSGNSPFSSSPASDLPSLDAVAISYDFPSEKFESRTNSPGTSSYVYTLHTMDTSAMPSDLHDLPEAPVHLGTKMDTKSMPMDMIPPAESCVLSAPQMDTSIMHTKLLGPADSSPPCAPNSPGLSSSLSSHNIPPLVTYPPADPMLLDPTDAQGLLLKDPGKQPANGSSPASPMAPAGTLAAARFHQPTIRTSPNTASGISTPAVKSESSLTVQFSTTHDEENESDTKRSHHEMSDEEDNIYRPNLIENIYGVEKRKKQPAKKIKTEHDVEDKPNMAKTPVSIPGDSGLGKWMKENNLKQTSVSTTPSVVDLTAGIIVLLLLFSLILFELKLILL